jgi:HD-like signal output (HDOD) protein
MSNQRQKSCKQCRYYNHCTARAYLCPAAELYADGRYQARERTIDAGMLDQISNVHYLDVINEMAAGIERRNALPRLIAPKLIRRLIIQALAAVEVPELVIALTFGISKRTVQRERLAPLP